MPLPYEYAQPAPTPPVIGFTGKALAPKDGSDEYHEHTPNGEGYFLWKKESVNGRPQWMPVDYVETPKNVV